MKQRVLAAFEANNQGLSGDEAEMREPGAGVVAIASTHLFSDRRECDAPVYSR
jgi:hypothetical protein